MKRDARKSVTHGANCMLFAFADRDLHRWHELRESVDGDDAVRYPFANVGMPTQVMRSTALEIRCMSLIIDYNRRNMTYDDARLCRINTTTVPRSVEC